VTVASALKSYRNFSQRPHSTDTTERNLGMPLLVPLIATAGRSGYWLRLLVALVLVAAAVQGKLSTHS
jgi:hypothetical protein